MALTADTSARLQKGLLVRDGYFITVRNSSCGKVMFLHLSVSHSVHGVGVYTSWADTPLSPETATPADGTHPTGMHFCRYTMYFETVYS